MRPMGRRLLTLDCSDHSALAVCDACGWRDGPFVDRTAARTAYRRHRALAHPKQAADAAFAARRRTS
jgi:hypothetical protein